jgi:serine/threonine protein kinase
MIADQVLSRIEYIHSKNYIHLGVKPDNFCIGQCGLIHAIDFGLSKRFINDSVHIPIREGYPLRGNSCYASINNHLGYGS